MLLLQYQHQNAKFSVLHQSKILHNQNLPIEGFFLMNVFYCLSLITVPVHIFNTYTTVLCSVSLQIHMTIFFKSKRQCKRAQLHSLFVTSS